MNRSSNKKVLLLLDVTPHTLKMLKQSIKYASMVLWSCCFRIIHPSPLDRSFFKSLKTNYNAAAELFGIQYIRSIWIDVVLTDSNISIHDHGIPRWKFQYYITWGGRLSNTNQSPEVTIHKNIWTLDENKDGPRHDPKTFNPSSQLTFHQASTSAIEITPNLSKKMKRKKWVHDLSTGASNSIKRTPFQGFRNYYFLNNSKSSFTFWRNRWILLFNKIRIPQKFCIHIFNFDFYSLLPCLITSS